LTPAARRTINLPGDIAGVRELNIDRAELGELIGTVQPSLPAELAREGRPRLRLFLERRLWIFGIFAKGAWAIEVTDAAARTIAVLGAPTMALREIDGLASVVMARLRR
jgi:hypothetical protein